MIGLPVALNAVSTLYNKLRSKGTYVGYWLTNDALGNQIRAGISMMSLQGISSLTSKIDDALPTAPTNPEDVLFQPYLYGDIMITSA